MAIESWLGFVAVFTLLSLPVGPNTIHTVTTSFAVGLPRGFLVPLGIAIASVLHSLVASLGFGLILLASAELFTVLKWVGAAYLLWLAVRLWRSAPGGLQQSHHRGSSPPRLIFSGFLISLTNPKAVLVYLAVLPPFISASQPLAVQLAVLIPTAATLAFLIYSVWAFLALPLRKTLAQPRRMRLFNRTAACFYFAGAATLALTRNK